ncbi:MAG: UDP-N-acetylglucosamine--N-acetylmuramyl-(pentapeptide) pyrophosphoryl-undecaprenol N-acetylglucosamine transferase [Candidatus Pacebacteria bacterium]|nr:UDP-N-acetylglucosamine--N-acetylmuramyl-(pentapeptide) pyrophosphoryl-undecaprenol N-acetylglucosamine transferase [Candidatus Paceibacterota bacterium]
MKILLTGGGTGGHFYPLIAVAEEINKIVKEEKLLPVQLYYMSDSPHDPNMLLENNIEFLKISAGKMRRYFSILNVFDFFRTISGVISALVKIFDLYPDVIFSKGAYSSFPVLVAAKLLRIPLFIHESDSVPGRTNLWAGKFAKRIAVSYPEATRFFDQSKVAFTGNPIRSNIELPQTKANAKQFLNLKEDIPTVLILGGSLGARIINEHILDILPQLVEKYYVIHQTGKNNIKEVTGIADVVLANSKNKDRYRPFDYLDNLNMSMTSGASDLVISRAGSAIFEIASWGLPSIIIPITDSNGDHQRKNAYYYSRTSGGSIIIEEANLSPNILLSEINRLIDNKELLKKMADGAKGFIKTDAAKIIAKEILNLGLKHDNN